ncbi:hypothetical protein QCE69_35615 [Caballeronia sp. LZ032]|nr:hypothetical protein [Caballeronia sp. LZ032]MDR5883628.1 hypothetical protein [Caballeronia sp. LZ032]
MSTSKIPDAVVKSWEDPDIRRKRLERHSVLCNGVRFPSFVAALKHFGIPDPTNRHIKIRGLLTSGESPRETWLHEGKEYVFELADPPGTNESTVADSGMPAVIEKTSPDMNTSLLDQILYGPPGTGKTYQTIEKTLEILDPQFLADNQERFALKRSFDELVEAGHIAFVTFHQSFSHEVASRAACIARCGEGFPQVAGRQIDGALSAGKAMVRTGLAPALAARGSRRLARHQLSVSHGAALRGLRGFSAPYARFR